MLNIYFGNFVGFFFSDFWLRFYSQTTYFGKQKIQTKGEKQIIIPVFINVLIILNSNK